MNILKLDNITYKIEIFQPALIIYIRSRFYYTQNNRQKEKYTITICNFATSNIGMGQNIYEILKRYWGYDTFRPLQEDIINSVLTGNDTLGLMPTGGGKSLTFQVPVLAMDGICLVITPLIALMKDQVDNLRARDIKAAYLYSGLTRHETIVTLENCIFGKYKFLYISPERLSNDLFLSKVKAMKVSLLVVDEAHCISQWGYDFRPSYIKIADIRTLFPDVPVLALTATATPQVVEDIQEKLHFKKGKVFQKSFFRPNLSYVVRYGENKIQQLIHILNRVPGSAIIYVRSRQKTKEIAEELRRFKISADFYHAGLKSEDKNRKQQSWKEDHCRVIVATNAFGMGIDKPDVRLVIHLDLPNSPEEYYQEAGRAGRDGLQAYAVILYANADKVKLEKRIRDMFPEREFISRVYEALGNFLQVAVGSGMNSVFDFNLNTFCKTFKFPILPTFNALKILEQAQYIEFTEEVESLSRVMITVQRDELYKLQTDDSEKEELLQCLLRSYTGLFADYVFIQEDLLSRRSGLSPQEVYENLIYFSKQHILHYIPQKRTPFIIYTTPREDLKYLSIPRNVYEERKERFSHRIHSMLEYVLHDKKCRTQILLNYFGETFNRECRLCDICLQQKSGELTSGDFSRIEKEIYKLLQADKCSLDTIIARIPLSQEKIVETLRFLCDEQFVQVKDGLYYI